MKINPLSEVLYRVKIAKYYLRDAENAFRRGDFRATVASSQLSAENSAKAVIAFYRIPSWSHNPAPELREVADQIPEDVKELALELADIAETLAPEHGRATYGEPLRGLTPWEIYSRDDAGKALNYARKALECAIKVLSRLGVENI